MKALEKGVDYWLIISANA